jgi:hypothetical protein
MKPLIDWRREVRFWCGMVVIERKYYSPHDWRVWIAFEVAR